MYMYKYEKSTGGWEGLDARIHRAFISIGCNITLFPNVSVKSGDQLVVFPADIGKPLAGPG